MIYATRSSPGADLWGRDAGRKYNRRPGIPGKLRLVACFLVAVAGHTLTGQEAAAPPPRGTWRPAPEYVRLFGPVGARASWYHAYVSPQGIDEVLQGLEGDGRFLRPPGSWTAAAVLPLDAFGLTGRYDRNKLTRVYGARRARVARGPVGAAERPNQTWTLVSPFPDPDFTRLQSGTLLLTLDLRGP